jgi:SAM-dependent methyltransferase
MSGIGPSSFQSLSDVTMSANTSAYSLGADARERERLIHQADELARTSERMLRDAGLRRGLRVLELGTGMGDVALLLAGILGPQGAVVGIERDPEMIAAARERLGRAGPETIRLIEGDVAALELDEPCFDAAVGRLILMHCPDPVAVVRAAARHVRPGGVVCFQEYEMSLIAGEPPAPLWNATADLIRETFGRLGANPHMGFELLETFRRAGLPTPTLRLEAPIGGGDDFMGYDMAASVVRTLLAPIERLGIARAGDIDIDSLADRLRHERASTGGIATTPAIVGAWAQIPHR